MSDRGMTLPRRGQEPVTLVFSPDDTLSGIRFWEHPELPSLIEAPAIGVTWYQEVWERRGWAVVSSGVEGGNQTTERGKP